MHFSDRLKTARMCEKGVKAGPWQLYYTPNHFKTQKMGDDVIRRDPYSLIGVPDCFVRSQQINIWHDSDDRDDEDAISWYKGYPKRRPQGSH